MDPSAYRSSGESSSSTRNVLQYSNAEVNPFPNPDFAQHRPTTLPILRIETDIIQTDRPEFNQIGSPSTQRNFYHPKKKYSFGEDSLRLREAPIFNKRETRRKKGPSSPTTVLTMAGLFVCGSTLMFSGIIVLCQQNEQPFIIAGSIFLALGTLMVIICVFLQRKNVIKYVLDINRDLYFLKMSDSYMWKLMFRDEDSTLPHQN